MTKFIDKFFTYSNWFIAYRKKKVFNIPFDSDGFQIIKAPAGRFFADPFLIKHEGNNYIFFEDFPLVRGRGVISFIKINADGDYSEPVVVLEKKYHLSYPFLFTWNNQIFMIPETGENKTIELYSAVDFPVKWELEKVLMTGINAYDTTIWFADQRVWMFTNTIAEGQSGNTDLSLFYANTIFDTWEKHPQNPVISNIASGRPAGNLFIDRGRKIRPSQNSSIRYGQELVFNMINTLTEEEYAEVKIGQIKANWYPGNLSCHTYNSNEDLEVIDGQLDHKSIMNLYRKIRKGL